MKTIKNLADLEGITTEELEEAQEILNDLSTNSHKINEHGGRISEIVKSLLELGQNG